MRIPSLRFRAVLVVAITAAIGFGVDAASTSFWQVSTQTEFLKGEIEHVPLPGDSVDVIISNCVINLSADKDAVLTEAFRLLKPGGRFAVSDVVVRGEVPAEMRRSVELWIGCVAGALEESEYSAKLARAGFEEVDVEPTRVYTAESARDYLAGAGLSAEAIASISGYATTSTLAPVVRESAAIANATAHAMATTPRTRKRRCCCMGGLLSQG